MNRMLKTITVLVATISLFSGCGLNPFGPGSGGLKIFARIAKAMERPSAVNENEQSKQGAKNLIAEGKGTAKRLAKSRTADEESWLDTAYISDTAGGLYVYCEKVTDKPSDEDPEKLVTGTGRVVFGYNGTLEDISQVNESNITNIHAFHFLGREEKTWKSGHADSVEFTVTFTGTEVDDIKPGLTTAWGMNISRTIELGRDDSAYFALDSLDNANHIQYGEGHFYDARTGEDNTEGPQSFDFTLQVRHINTRGGNPYDRYEDNEGMMYFYAPWGESKTDSLYFTINFYPDYYRDGTIRKNGSKGPVLVRFTWNEKTEQGTVTYYDEDGNEIGSE